MKHEMLCGAARTVTDGLKDAQKHISEAHKRLAGIADWMALLEETEDAKTPLCRVLLDHYKHWHRDLTERVEHFHASGKT